MLRDKPKPLALYLFTSSKDFQKKILRELSFGGGCINDVILHVASPHLGFGGVGASGMGSYHGKNSFDTFTHYKSIVEKGTWLDVPIRYRPYTEITGRLLGMKGKK
jgi:aldehyde dehydrogenase (NAD+)